MLEYWIVALGLMLVLEGTMPLLFPQAWRITLRRISRMRDGQVRFVGLVSMLSGLMIVYWMKN